MKIQGKFDTYDVVWITWGWSYAKAVVRKRVKFLGISYWKKVWCTGSGSGFHGGTTHVMTAEKMKKEPMTQWFENAVKEYEEYYESWSK